MTHYTTQSMTAFARGEAEQNGNQITWEIRSVNHRYLDTHLKLPDELRALETDCRATVSAKLNRGRIDAQLKLEQNQGSDEPNRINQPLLENLSQLFDQIQSVIPDSKPASVTDILRWPGMMLEPKENSEALHQQALMLLDQTLDTLKQNRQREGSRLGEMIHSRINECRELVAALSEKLPAISENQTQKWQQRITTLCQDPDNQRLHQEIAIILTKSDISEEIDRLNTHFDEVQRTLTTNKPAGRRLDFLMQELNREANTLGSKSIDQHITDTSVQLKVLIDQMREQVQNLE